MSRGMPGFFSSSILGSTYFLASANRSAIPPLNGNRRESVVVLQDSIIYGKGAYYGIITLWFYGPTHSQGPSNKHSEGGPPCPVGGGAY